MHLLKTLRRQLTLSALVLMLGGMNAEAGLFGIGGTSWKEEVLLHDGSKIIVERAVNRGGRHEIGQRPSYVEQSLEFTMPASKEEVTWEDHLSEDLGNSSFLPMLLDIKNGIAYLVVTPMGCLSYNKWGRPNPPYVVFKYQGKEWQRIPLEELPAEFKTPNLVISSPDDVADEKASRGLVSAEVIKQENEGFKQPEFRTILRELLPAEYMKRMCMEEVTNGRGKWLSIDWFSDEKNKQACKTVCERNDFDAQHCPCDKLFERE